jgi:tryptophan synthase alpha chain
MGRISERFNALKGAGRKGFIPFVTAGDPDLEESLEIVLTLSRLGADVIELGVPFSDPMADGPTIQRSSQRALANGVNVIAILDLVREVRRSVETPIVLFSYFNPLLRFGIDRLVDEAGDAGIDGILVTDVVDAEAAELSRSFLAAGIDLISLVAPTTTDERLERISKTSTGFLYAVSRAGVTGARSDVNSDAESLVARTRRYTDLPIAVGFGISTRQQISDVWRYADAAVVGSAIVSQIEKSEPADARVAVESFVNALLPPFANSGEEL